MKSRKRKSPTATPSRFIDRASPPASRPVNTSSGVKEQAPQASQTKSVLNWTPAEIDLVLNHAETAKDALPTVEELSKLYTNLPSVSFENEPAVLLQKDELPDTLSRFMLAREQKITAPLTGSSSHMQKTGLKLFHLLSVSGQLYGWRHAAACGENKEEYMTQLELAEKAVAMAESIAPAVNAAPSAAPVALQIAPEKVGAPQNKMQKCEEESKKLIHDVMLYASWVLDIEGKNSIQDGKTAERVLGVLSKDTNWVNNTEAWLKEAEANVAAVTFSPRMMNFKRMDRKIEWPFDPLIKKDFEEAGFKYFPSRTKRDTFQCNDCGAVLFGVRPWHRKNRWELHAKVPHAIPSPTASLEKYAAAVVRWVEPIVRNPEAEAKRLTAPPFVEHLPAIIQILHQLKNAGVVRSGLGFATAGESLLTLPNYRLILQHASFAAELASGLYWLRQEELLNQDTFELLVRHARNASAIDYFSKYGLRMLHNAQLDIGPQGLANLDVFMSDPQAITQELRKIPAEELTQARFERIIQRLYNVQRIAPLVSFVRAHSNSDSAIKKSIMSVTDTILNLTGMAKHSKSESKMEEVGPIQASSKEVVRRSVDRLNAALKPLGIATPDTDTLEESLLRLAGIDVAPTRCQYDAPPVTGQGDMCVIYFTDCPAENIVSAFNRFFPGINARDITAECNSSDAKYIAINSEIISSEPMVKEIVDLIRQNPVLLSRHRAQQDRGRVPAAPPLSGLSGMRHAVLFPTAQNTPATASAAASVNRVQFNR
jgi:hypothetical protein